MNGVGMVANCQREAAIECAAGVAEFLGSRGRAVQMAPDLAVALGRPELGLPEDRLGEAEFLLAFGGDGTLLAANRAAAPHRTPVLGVHVGGPASFGFMMEATPAGAIEAVTAVLEQRCRIEERIMVAAEVLRAGACVRRYSALNDLVIRAESRMLKLRVEISGEYIATYAADGIILATPTGSTAYNLAAGGPLVHPSVQAILLTPICPHTLNVRSLLAAVTSQIQVRLETGARDTSLLIVDGQARFQLEPQDEVLFRQADEPARFLTLDTRSFYEKVHSRLRLGERFGS